MHVLGCHTRPMVLVAMAVTPPPCVCVGGVPTPCVWERVVCSHSIRARTLAGHTHPLHVALAAAVQGDKEQGAYEKVVILQIEPRALAQRILDVRAGYMHRLWPVVTSERARMAAASADQSGAGS